MPPLGEEREKIRDEVYDAMSEPDPPKANGKEAVNGDAKVEKEENSMETEENKENVENKSEEIKETVGKKPMENKSEEEIKNEKNKSGDLNKNKENGSEMETDKNGSVKPEKKAVNGEINGSNKAEVLTEVKGENGEKVEDKPEAVAQDEKSKEMKEEAKPTDEAKPTEEAKPTDKDKTETSEKEGDTEAMEVTDSSKVPVELVLNRPLLTNNFVTLFIFCTLRSTE